jgi:hypothetical protein
MQCNGNAKLLGKIPAPFHQHEKLVSSVALLAVCRLVIHLCYTIFSVFNYRPVYLLHKGMNLFFQQ